MQSVSLLDAMEVCVDSVQSAVNAEDGGAKRVELCCNMSTGGTTPTLGLLKIVKRRVQIPVFVMIRPRGGDFLYCDEEFQVMKEDILSLKKGGADGFVFGILNRDGTVDENRCSELLVLAQPNPVTFHRAFDMTQNPHEALETLILLGFDRVLTSGQAETALKGLALIHQLVILADSRLIIMPGSGINIENLENILIESGVHEFHGSASVSLDSRMQYRNQDLSMGTGTDVDEYSLQVTEKAIVSNLVEIAKRVWSNDTKY